MVDFGERDSWLDRVKAMVESKSKSEELRRARYLSDYEKALAEGRFKHAQQMIKSTKKLRIPKRLIGKDINYEGNPIGKGDYMDPITNKPLFTRRAAFLKVWLKRLGQSLGESLNSPLLDLFGPVHMNEAMRKARGVNRRKYLVEDDGEI